MAACASTKVVHLDFLEDAALVTSSRPVEGDYTIGQLATVQACEEDGAFTVQDLVERATGNHDALVQVTIERRLQQTYRVPVSVWGMTKSAPVLESQDVCYQVHGYTVDMAEAPAASPIATPERAPEPEPGPADTGTP